MCSNERTFNQPLKDWHLGNVTEMDNIFYDETSYNQPLCGWIVNNCDTRLFTLFTTQISY